MSKYASNHHTSKYLDSSFPLRSAALFLISLLSKYL
jgi:hypothetical protein